MIINILPLFHYHVHKCSAKGVNRNCGQQGAPVVIRSVLFPF